jgi:hypothetical protein
VKTIREELWIGLISIEELARQYKVQVRYINMLARGERRKTKVAGIDLVPRIKAEQDRRSLKGVPTAEEVAAAKTTPTREESFAFIQRKGTR